MNQNDCKVCKAQKSSHKKVLYQLFKKMQGCEQNSMDIRRIPTSNEKYNADFEMD